MYQMVNRFYWELAVKIVWLINNLYQNLCATVTNNLLTMNIVEHAQAITGEAE